MTEQQLIHWPTLWAADRGPLVDRYRTWRSSTAGQAVYLDAVRRARILRRAGFAHYGIGAIVEAIRYDRAIQVRRDEAGFRINNNHRALLAREIMEVNPDLAGFFTLRERTAL
jgi:hypothetical protein